MPQCGNGTQRATPFRICACCVLLPCSHAWTAFDSISEPEGGFCYPRRSQILWLFSSQASSWVALSLCSAHSSCLPQLLLRSTLHLLSLFSLFPLLSCPNKLWERVQTPKLIISFSLTVAEVNWVLTVNVSSF